LGRKDYDCSGSTEDACLNSPSCSSAYCSTPAYAHCTWTEATPTPGGPTPTTGGPTPTSGPTPTPECSAGEAVCYHAGRCCRPAASVADGTCSCAAGCSWNQTGGCSQGRITADGGGMNCCGGWMAWDINSPNYCGSQTHIPHQELAKKGIYD